MTTFQIGDRVQGGKGEDHDVGTVVEDDGGGDVGTGAVLVAWDSGVRTWTPVSLIEPA